MLIDCTTGALTLFLKFKRKAREIFYYKTEKGLEVDFLMRMENAIELIQVCVTLENEETRKRELRVFSEAKKELKEEITFKVITMDKSHTVEYDGCKIEIVNILDFLCLDTEVW